MKIWIDAHISPGIAAWLNENFDFEVSSLTALGLREANDLDIFEKGRSENVIFVTKDSDFADLVELRGAPPKVILLRCGNTTNKRLREIFAMHLNEAISKFEDGEILIEIE